MPEARERRPGGFPAGETSLPGLHPLLKQHVDEILAEAPGAPLSLDRLFLRLSDFYRQIDEERRGVVRSMQMMSEEARSLREERREQEDREGDLRLILDHVSDAVVAADAGGRVQMINPAGERLFGIPRSAVLEQEISRLLPALQSSGRARKLLAKLAQPVSPSEPAPRHTLRARRHNDTEFPVEVAVSRVRMDRRELFVLCLRDLSEQMRAERALRESEARFRTLVDHAPEAIVVFDAAIERFIDGNRNAEHLYAVSREQLLSRNPGDFTVPLQPDGTPSGERMRAHIALALAGEPQRFEWLHRDARGAEIPCEIRLVHMPGGSGQLLRCSLADVSDRKRRERITAGERTALERVAGSVALPDALESIVDLVESAAPELRASVSVLSHLGDRFELLVAPRLPRRVTAILDRTEIDLRNGSCAAAVYLGRPVLAVDVETDPHWRTRGALMVEEGLRAAWSMPIRGTSGRVVGALGVYRGAAGGPERPDIELMADAARLAGIAIERRRAEEALRSSESKFRGLFESVMEGVYQSTPDGRLLSVNPAFVKILGYGSAEELYALPSAAMVYWSPADRVEFTRQIELHGEIRNAEFTLRRRDGAQIVVLESARAIRDPDGLVTGYEGTIADITERKRAEQAIFQEKERAQVTLQSIGDAVITADAAGRIEYMNPVAEQLTGWKLSDAQGREIGDVLRIVSDATQEPLENPLLRALRSAQRVGPTDHSTLLDRDGQGIPIQDSAAPIRDRAGRVVGAVVVFHDVTRERRLRRALAYQASHDSLTGLINRREFDSRLHAALEATRERQVHHAVLYVDLDQFKLVNDTCGHSAGDRLIREITGLLQAKVRASDVIARLGGDEFGVLLEDCDLAQACAIADSLRQAIRDHRFVWEGNTLSVGASVGIVELTPQTESVAALMSAADVACYAAKDQGRNRVEVYTFRDGHDRHREMKWVAQIARAVDENRLECLFQTIRPLHAMPEQSFHEITVRMRDENGTLVAPGLFIPAAERYNVMSLIDLWVMQDALRTLRALPESRPLPLLAVNVSGSSLNDQRFLEKVLALLDSERLARALCFEITETAAVASLDNAANFMRELRSRGCRFSLDDFGSGLSSFRYLKTLPVDFLKIDGQFVANVAVDVVDRSMVQAIVQVGRSLGIATVAEKVETGTVLRELAALGVDYGQGFHIAMPQPLHELGAALAAPPPAGV